MRRLSKRLTFLVVCILGCASISYGALITMTPSDVLEITFQSNAIATDDVLEIISGSTTVNDAVGLVTVDLFDGSTLLGSHSSALFSNSSTGLVDAFDGIFKSSTSLISPGTVVDFSTLADQSIDGRAQIRIDSGEFVLDTDLFIVRTGTSTGPGSIDAFRNAEITGAKIATVPEPTSLLLVSTGILGCFVTRLRKVL